jgi:glycosyltransferase involved in cell wall biosynthesis
MASGRPLVATHVPAVTELLTHGHNAWLCRPNDPHDAARWLLRALEQPEQAREQAEQARRDAAALVCRERMIEEYRRVYARLSASQALTAEAASPSATP